jgi:thiamine-monophosphate kinase
MSVKRPGRSRPPSSSSGNRQASEFDLIARLKAVLDKGAPTGPLAPPLPVIGIGDDAAAVRRGKLVDLYTTDTLVDGTHFRSGQVAWSDLGWKAMAVNQSDIAAMGGQPLYALVTLGLPPGFNDDHIAEIYRGIADACDRFGGRVAGGDIVRCPVLFVSIALTGAAVVPATRAPGARPGGGHAPNMNQQVPAWDAALLRRDAAAPGDLIAVTGPLGSSAGGLRALALGINSPDGDALKAAHFRPQPRVREGVMLAKRGVSAAMDISDGLVADLEKMAAMSKVGARISLDRVPVDPALVRAFPDEWRQLALGGGEDYELLFTAPLSVMEAVLPELGPRAAIIGEVTRAPARGGPVVIVTDSTGARVPVAHAGWDHRRDE